MSQTRTAEELSTRYPGGGQNPGFPRIADALLREGRLDDAVALATEGLQAQPDLLSGRLVLARCHQQAGRLDEAKTQFEAALRIDPRCPSARYHLAQIAEQLQWKSVALEHWRTLCDIEPWDETAREAYGRMLREAPGSAPAPKLTQSYAPFAPSSTGAANTAPFTPEATDKGSIAPESLSGAGAMAGLGAAGVPEYSLDTVGDFLPKEDNAADLAAALPHDSEWSLAAMASDTLDATQVQTPSETRAPDADRAMPAEAAPAPFPEPKPLDLLGETGTKPAEGQPLEAAPFSGEDVASRLNALFGLGGDEAVETQPETPTAENPPTEMQAEPLGGSEEAGMGSATAYAQAGETGFLEGPSPVEGDDVAARLDHLFDLGDTQIRDAQIQEAAKASQALDLDLGETSAWTAVEPEPAAPEARTTASESQPGEPTSLEAAQTEATENEPAESEARAAGESNILAVEDVFDTPSSEPEVTGNDIADRLDALFDESAGASAVFSKSDEVSVPAVPRSDGDIPAETATSVSALTEPTVPPALAPAMPSPFDPGFDGRETMILSLDSLKEPQGEQVEPVISFGSQGLETVDLKPPSEAPLFATEDALTPESLGLPEVGGGDIGQRLDDLFGAEPETTSTPRVTVPISQTESVLETAIAPSPELAFEAPVREEAVVSGDDISSRLAEIFGTPDEDSVTATQASENLARGTHFEVVDQPTMAIQVPGAVEGHEGHGGQSPETGEWKTADLTGGAAAQVTRPDDTGLDALSDADFPPWLQESTPSAVAAPAGQPTPLIDEDEPAEEDEAFEPATTSVATVTLAEIYFSQGLKEQALQIYRQLSEREPENESVRKRILEIEASKADGDDKGSGPDDSRPRPGLKIPRRKK